MPTEHTEKHGKVGGVKQPRSITFQVGSETPGRPSNSVTSAYFDAAHPFAFASLRLPSVPIFPGSVFFRLF